MKIINDKSCSWINDLPSRDNIRVLSNDQECDWLIIGAGYTGLSAARKLSEIHPEQRIIIVDFSTSEYFLFFNSIELIY